MKHFIILIVLGLGTAALAPAQTLPSWGEPTMPAELPPLDPMDFEFGDDLNGPGLPGAPTPVPIDGGLGLLGAAGAAYALNRLRKRKEQEGASSEESL